ncbi:putative sugar O-methyltransferase [Patescibacteria group bacterium]|nr:putative sugar O-methyltransferase [Patescibacteria group bacterium]
MLGNLDKRISRKKGQFQKLASRTPFLGKAYFYSHTEEGVRLANMLLHKNVKGYPLVKLSLIQEIKPTKKDFELTKRLLKAYKKAVFDQGKYSHEDIWTFLVKGPHAYFFELLKKEAIEEIAYYLCNMSKMGITHGITQGEIEFERINSDSTYRNWLGLSTLDKTIAFAEILGEIPLEDPEQGDYGNVIFSDIDKILGKIKKNLKISIKPPGIEGGAYKLKTAKGNFDIRDIMSLYTAWRCKEILRGTKASSICEIGAGIGKTAYYSNLFGIGSYTIIDLPHINILQGFYLIKSLPQENISLYGEKNKGTISILPDFSFGKINGKIFDLILNQDSFPEIDKKIVLDYLQKIKLHTKGLFFSINQESQNTMMIGNLRQHIVSDLVSKTKGFERVHRFPYWMREGYLEELYRVHD